VFGKAAAQVVALLQRPAQRAVDTVAFAFVQTGKSELMAPKPVLRQDSGVMPSAFVEIFDSFRLAQSDGGLQLCRTIHLQIVAGKRLERLTDDHGITQGLPHHKLRAQAPHPPAQWHRRHG
jgi:hypothetical protein